MSPANPNESSVKKGTVHYQGITVQLRFGGKLPVLIEFRSEGDYDFDRDATAARDHVEEDLKKQDNDPLSADGDFGTIGGTQCLFYTSLF